MSGPVLPSFPLSPPTLEGFQWFVTNIMDISSTYLPTDSIFIPYAFNIALVTTNKVLACIPPPIYSTAVYNLAGDTLINVAQDQPGDHLFQGLREKFNINGFVGGVISFSADQATSESLNVPTAMDGLTFGDLQTLKTPWGRTYLAIAQSAGPVLWGIS